MTDSQVKRKLIEILRVLSESEEAMGARTIADELNRRGFQIGERAVRYHLRILDEKGFTEKNGYYGRTITEKGRRELGEALVKDRVGFILSRIEDLMYRTTFDPFTGDGDVVVNTSIVDKRVVDRAMYAMEESREFVVSPYYSIVEEGERFSDIVIPPDHVGIVTMCSITFDGVFLQNGIPVDIEYGGTIALEKGSPTQFLDLIGYAGTSLDPIQILMARGMTSILRACRDGDGCVLANIREIPVNALEKTREIIEALNRNKIGGVVQIGDPGEPLGLPTSLGQVSIPIYAGANAIAAMEEMGINTQTRVISTLIPFSKLDRL